MNRGSIQEVTVGGVQEAGDGLLVGMNPRLAGRATTDEARAAQWFAQDDFATAPTLDDAAACELPQPPPPNPHLCTRAPSASCFHSACTCW